MLSPPSRVFNGFDGMEILTTGSLSKLTFFNVSDADYGNYTCVAINKLGSSNTSFLLYGKKRLVQLRMTRFQQKYQQTKRTHWLARCDFIISPLQVCASSSPNSVPNVLIELKKKQSKMESLLYLLHLKIVRPLWFWIFRELVAGSASWLLMRHIKNNFVKVPWETFPPAPFFFFSFLTS